MDIWKLLQIEPTNDVAAIKKAYAGQAKKFNPEEYPDEFLKLRQAYQQALALAEDAAEMAAETSETRSSGNAGEKGTAGEAGVAVSMSAMGLGQDEQSTDKQGQTEPGVANPTEMENTPLFSFSPDLADEGPDYDNCAAILKFRELYFEKKCKDRNLWLKYLTSHEFLDVAFEKGFTRALLQALSNETAIEKSFFGIISLVYGVAQIPGRKVEQGIGLPWTQFDGIEDIVAIVRKGKPPYRIKGSDRAIANGFQDYVALLELVKSGKWNDHIGFQFSRLMDRYVSAYIYDKIPQNQGLYSSEYLPRHTSSLKLLDYFFETVPLPRQAYEILWNKLDLRNATMGRNQVFYGRLREITLEKVPEIEAVPKESFAEFRKTFMQFCQADYKQEDRERTERLLAQEDLRLALHDQFFVENDVLRTWLTDNRSKYFLEKLADLCERDNDVVHRDRILMVIREELSSRRINDALKADANSPAGRDEMSAHNRAFFRYLLDVAFHRAYSSEKSLAMAYYLSLYFPGAMAWNRRLAGVLGEAEGSAGAGEGSSGNPPVFSVSMGGRKLEIICHVRHLEYRFDDKPVYAPFVHFDNLRDLEDDTLFWMLAPVAFAQIGSKQQVVSALTERLSRLEFLRELDLPLIADAIAGNICKHYETEYYPECLRLRRELQDSLYCCDIYPGEGALVLYVNEPGLGDRLLREELLPQGDVPTLIDLGCRMLSEHIDPVDMDHLKIEWLPVSVTVNVRHAPVRQYDGEDVTYDVVKDALQMLYEGKLVRLALQWRGGEDGTSRYLVMNSGKQVLMSNEKNIYGCFCFDDKRECRYSLLGLPEIYRTVDCKEVQSVPFGGGKLESYNVHQSWTSILRHINHILQEVSNLSRDLEDPLVLWSRNWGPAYHVEKCLLGGFPALHVFTNPASKFVIKAFPALLELKTADGETKSIPINPATRPCVQEQLLFFMRQRLSRLRLTWDMESAASEAEPNPQTYQVHVLLLHDADRFMMLYLNESRDSMHYLVADKAAYMKIEGKKFKKTEFCGTMQPDHLVHKDLSRIRAYLDILLPNITDPQRILGMFGEFAYGFYSPKPKSYEESKEEYFKL